MNLEIPAAQRGFTMIEMLIVVAIIGIIAAIAFPSYRSYVERTNRTVAKAALSNLASRQEGYSADHKAYTGNFARLGVSGTGTDNTAYLDRQGNLSMASSSSALYRLRLHDTASGGTTCTGLGSGAIRFTYVLVATPIETRTDSRCGTICLSSSGQRGATGGTEACWGR